MNTFFKLTFVLSLLTSYSRCMDQTDLTKISDVPHLFIKQEDNPPQDFEKLFTFGKAIFKRMWSENGKETNFSQTLYFPVLGYALEYRRTRQLYQDRVTETYIEPSCHGPQTKPWDDLGEKSLKELFAFFEEKFKKQKQQEEKSEDN